MTNDYSWYQCTNHETSHWKQELQGQREKNTHFSLSVIMKFLEKFCLKKESIVQVNVQILRDEVKIVSVLEIPEVPEGKFLIMY